MANALALGEQSLKNENVKVFVRIKPEDNEKSIHFSISKESAIFVSRSQEIKDKKMFKFNRIFEQTCSQLELYKNVVSHITEGCFQGYNGTVFAYGQSGTGKTHTMLGDVLIEDQRGIIPNVFFHIFARISLSDQQKSYAVTVSFLEIYNEQVFDLLAQNNSYKNLEVRENPERGVYVKNLTEHTVESFDQALKLLKKGNEKRTVGFTKLNDVSSRSHAIFFISVEAKNRETNEATFAKLNLVDLAGSERVSKSFACGDKLKEAGKINLSLSMLGNVISALVDGRTNHIPYRNSKLTRLLQDSLGGSCRTSLIATISPSIQNFEETLYTLMYANRVKHVTNVVKKNEENVSVLKTLEDEILVLRAKLEELINHEERKITKRKIKQYFDKNNDEEIKALEKHKEHLLEKIENIQKKILIGGENLIEKAQQQMDMLKSNENEIKLLDSCHELLKQIFSTKGEEKIVMEQQCSTLEEEDQLLDKRIREAEKKLKKYTKVLYKKEQEYQNEISNLLYTNKCLAKDMGVASTVINNTIPNAYLLKIQNNIVFDEDIQDFRLKYVHLMGLQQRRKHVEEKIDFGSVEKMEKCFKKYF